MLSLASTPFAGSSRLECYRESFVNDQSPIPPFDETNAFEGTDPTSKYMFVFSFSKLVVLFVDIYIYISCIYIHISYIYPNGSNVCIYRPHLVMYV